MQLHYPDTFDYVGLCANATDEVTQFALKIDADLDEKCALAWDTSDHHIVTRLDGAVYSNDVERTRFLIEEGGVDVLAKQFPPTLTALEWVKRWYDDTVQWRKENPDQAHILLTREPAFEVDRPPQGWDEMYELLLDANQQQESGARMPRRPRYPRITGLILDAGKEAGAEGRTSMNAADAIRGIEEEHAEQLRAWRSEVDDVLRSIKYM